jgi:malonyl-CoA O-methyltransferase
MDDSVTLDPYAAWAPRYPPHAHNALMEVEQAAVLSLLPPVAGRTVLDAGCGTGRYVQLLTALGAKVLGLDVSAAMVQRARVLTPLVIRGDMQALPIASGRCHLVVSGLAVIDVPDLAPVVNEWSRVLCRRGVVVFSTLHPAGQALGWKRTYDDGGTLRSLPAFWHTLDDHRRACRASGLEIEAAEQPSLPRDDQPVALVVRARKHS